MVANVVGDTKPAAATAVPPMVIDAMLLLAVNPLALAVTVCPATAVEGESVTGDPVISIVVERDDSPVLATTICCVPSGVVVGTTMVSDPALLATVTLPVEGLLKSASTPPNFMEVTVPLPYRTEMGVNLW